ncbi:dihydrofolate reductase family protein [Streptomyces sp. WM6372]|uniref:dihydrofolate reductase family protein n=1 Tax=Streptomyces sp. WM6372 TaxID=1415555 RepID=UPI000ADB7708|nr:dihydrofolate reductase family protein [Streptomyces sp. WM6372]
MILPEEYWTAQYSFGYCTVQYHHRRSTRAPSPTEGSGHDDRRTQDRNNTTVIDGDLITFLKDFKQQPGGNINLSGSISLTRTLLEAGLLDELRLLVHPIVLGAGKRLFPDGTGLTPLRLTASATFSTGVLDLTYQPA